MLYLATSPCEPAVNDLLSLRRIGLMCQPASNPPRAGWLWAADNGCFSDTWNEERWERWLEREMPRSGCLFAVVPDVVADAFGTLDRFDEYVSTVRDLRYPVAFVAQDGLLPGDAPYRDFDCLFIGGSTEWKLSEVAHEIAREARSHGKWVHVGRVNSGDRFRAWASDADSCDGTFLAFGPKQNLPRLVAWLDAHDESPQLWSVT